MQKHRVILVVLGFSCLYAHAVFGVGPYAVRIGFGSGS